MTKPGFIFCAFCVVVYFATDACLLLLFNFVFSVVSQQIGGEERLQNDMFCVRWDVSRNLNSISQL